MFIGALMFIAVTIIVREMESGLVKEATGLAKEYIRVKASTCGMQN